MVICESHPNVNDAPGMHGDCKEKLEGSQCRECCPMVQGL